MKAVLFVIFLYQYNAPPIPLTYEGYGQRFSDEQTCEVAAKEVKSRITLSGMTAVCLPIQWEK